MLKLNFLKCNPGNEFLFLFQDYMENVHGKDISLQYVTVKVPGQKPRGSRSVAPGPTNNQNNINNSSSADQNAGGLSGTAFKGAGGGEKKGEKVLLTGYEMLGEPSGGEDNDATFNTTITNETPNTSKKRHRKIKTNGTKSNADLEGTYVI